jgi:hypothetical protein
MKSLLQGRFIGEGHALDIEMNRCFDCLPVGHIDTSPHIPGK